MHGEESDPHRAGNKTEPRTFDTILSTEVGGEAGPAAEDSQQPADTSPEQHKEWEEPLRFREPLRRGLVQLSALTMSLSGRLPHNPERGGRTIFPGARGADHHTCHGRSKRWLDGI